MAPASWLVVRDVARARAALNLTDWQTYDVDRRVALRASIGPVTVTHRMPLWYYVTLHPDARLAPREYEILREWSERAAEERGPR